MKEQTRENTIKIAIYFFIVLVTIGYLIGAPMLDSAEAQETEVSGSVLADQDGNSVRIQSLGNGNADHLLVVAPNKENTKLPGSGDEVTLENLEYGETVKVYAVDGTMKGQEYKRSQIMTYTLEEDHNK